MASDEHQPAELSSPPAPERPATASRRWWSWRRTAVTAAIVVGVAAAGGAAIAVAADDVPRRASAAESGAGPGPGGPGPAGRGGLGGMVHGEFVVPDGDGGYATRLVQHGKLTEIDGDRITVVSDDGYSRTYSTTSSTEYRGVDSLADLKVDALVVVIANEDGAALSVGDRSARPERGPGGPLDRQRGHDRGGPAERGTPPGPPATPEPTG